MCLDSTAHKYIQIIPPFCILRCTILLTHTQRHRHVCTCTPVHTEHSHSLHLYMCVGRHILCSTEQCVHTYPVGISDSTPATSSCAAWVHISDTPHNWTWPPKNIAGCHNRQKEQLTTENHVCTQCSLSLFTTVTLEMPTHCTILLSQCQLCHRALGWSIRMSSEVFAILVLCESTSPSVSWVVQVTLSWQPQIHFSTVII